MHPMWLLFPAAGLGFCTAVCAKALYQVTHGGVRPADRMYVAHAVAITLFGAALTAGFLLPVAAYLNPWSAL